MYDVSAGQFNYKAVKSMSTFFMYIFKERNHCKNQAYVNYPTFQFLKNSKSQGQDSLKWFDIRTQEK